MNDFMFNGFKIIENVNVLQEKITITRKQTRKLKNKRWVKKYLKKYTIKTYGIGMVLIKAENTIVAHPEIIEKLRNQIQNKSEKIVKKNIYMGLDYPVKFNHNHTFSGLSNCMS